jgi:pyruvate dehydrogenase E1 component alpha subunit
MTVSGPADAVDGPRETDQVGEPQVDVMMEQMIAARVWSTRLFNLQRQGRIGTMAPTDGSEAVVVGAAHALDPELDWVFPQYREQVALSRFGDEIIDSQLLYSMGHPAGGRYPDHVHVFPAQISLATQVPHAVGFAWGMRLQGEPGCVLVFLGDGSTSEGDFYEAGNLAGVCKAPVIIVVVNNGWAISTPLRAQTASDSFADKAQAFGMPGVQVDGRDPVAVYEVIAAARRLAVQGEGPTLVEAVTYRLGPHTTADDHTRYVPADDLADARRHDPVVTFAAHLTDLGQWDEDRTDAATKAADERFDLALERAEGAGLEPDAFFDHVFATPTVRMQRQRQRLREGTG